MQCNGDITPIFLTLRICPSFSLMKLPSTPLFNSKHLKKIKETRKRLNTMRIDQTTPVTLSFPPRSFFLLCTHEIQAPTTKSRRAGGPASVRRQRKEAWREGAQPRTCWRRGLHQHRRRPRAKHGRLPPAAGRRHGLQRHGRRPQSKCGRRSLQRLGRRSRVKRRRCGLLQTQSG
jgi:hypothetical protein